MNGVPHWFSSDHLGSVREVTDTAGLLLARYDFAPMGRRELVAGADLTTVGYTGHRAHQASGLTLAPLRALDTTSGRWISEDPLRLNAGPNFYAYVDNMALVQVDPFGLAGSFCAQYAHFYLYTSLNATITRHGAPELVASNIDSPGDLLVS